MSFLTEFLPWIGIAIGTANAVTAVTPTKTDDEFLSKILGVINFVAMNFGRNTNADEKAD
jgi:hypothetical protein